jgi:G patch domain-containing protein 1
MSRKTGSPTLGGYLSWLGKKISKRPTGYTVRIEDQGLLTRRPCSMPKTYVYRSSLYLAETGLTLIFFGEPQRAQMLGEEEIKAPRRSVFDYLSSETKDRLEAFKASVLRNRGAAPSEPSGPIDIVIPPLDPAVALGALKGFMPFVQDPAKQARYRAFLEYHARAPGDGRRPPDVLAPHKGTSVDEFNKELEGFAASARIFKPMTGMMASRFTSSTSVGPAPLEPGLSKPAPIEELPAGGGEPAQEGAAKAEVKDESPAAKAARLEMFGHLTRSSTPFVPVRLLCKRFNVPDPWPDGPPQGFGGGGGATAAGGGGGDTGGQPSREALNRDTMDEILKDRGIERPSPPVAATTQPVHDDSATADGGRQRRRAPRDIATVGLGEDEAQGRDTLTYERPPMDIFTAIFAESDDEEEGGGDDDGRTGPPENGLAAPAAAAATTTTAVPSDPFAPLSTPSAKSTTPAQQEPVDLSNFRPTFVSKAGRSNKPDSSPATTTASPGDHVVKKKKSSKKISKRVSTVSFDLDEGGDDDVGGGSSSSSLVKKRKRKETGSFPEKKERAKPKRVEGEGMAGGEAAEEEAEEVWVEKETARRDPSVAAGEAKRKRMHAADFL